MKYRATCTILWDFETELPYEQALQEARKHLDEIPVKDGINDIRIVVQLDKLKSKVEKIKLGEFSVDDVFENITINPTKKEYECGGKKYVVKMNSDRYITFQKNRSCVACGLQITKVFLECHVADMTPHFNMYGQEDAKLILFTKDHIQAKAFGGIDDISNYQTMCATCNSLKAHSNLSVESLRELRKLYDDNKKILPKKKLHFLIEENRIKLEQPWAHNSSKISNKTKDACCLNKSICIYEMENTYVGLAESEKAENCRQIGVAEKGSWLQVVLEINNFYFCPMFRDKTVKIDKNLFEK